MAFSPHRKRLASASRDKTVKMWDATPLPEARNDVADPKKPKSMILGNPRARAEFGHKLAYDRDRERPPPGEPDGVCVRH